MVGFRNFLRVFLRKKKEILGELKDNRKCFTMHFFRLNTAELPKIRVQTRTFYKPK